MLDRLRAEGRQLGIVTAKRRKTVELAFAILPLERYFDAVVTRTDGAPQARPRACAESARAARREPEEAAFVGDSPYDVGAGKAAGVFTVGVSWGKIHPVERLREAGADLVVHSPEELLDVL